MKALSVRDKILNFIRSIDDRFYENTKQTRVLFVYTNNYGFSCQVPVIEALSKIDNIKLHITTNKTYDVDESDFSNQSEYSIFLKNYMPHAKATFTKWHLIIDTHLNSFYPKRNALRIGMHHGPGFGIMGSKIELAKNYDIFFGLSQTERRYFENIEPDVFDLERAFFPIGFPKSDFLVNKSCPQHEVRQELMLNNRTTILIASHWESLSTLRTFGPNIFELLCKTFPEYNIVQTGHPWLWEGYQQTPTFHADLVKELKVIQNRFTNAYFLPIENTDKLLQASDLLISDHSSILTTYSLLDRPIIWFENPKLNFSIPEIRGIYRGASDTFEDINKLPDLCRQALTKPQKKAAGREIMRETYFTNPGQSGEKAAEILAKIGSTSSTKSPRWQLVLDESHKTYSDAQSKTLLPEK